MTSTTSAASARRVALELIDVGDNVRELDQAHVDALAASIALQGILVPLVMRAAGEGSNCRYELVAGFHRYVAASKLGLREVPVVLRGENEDDGLGVAADRATENILRKQLNPYEQAIAVKAMLDRGLTKAGAAQALGWSEAKVSQRARLLALADDVARGFGEGYLSM